MGPSGPLLAEEHDMKIWRDTEPERSDHPERRDGGFNLIELLVVIVIVGILASVVVSAVASARDNSDEASCAADQRQIETAVEAHYTQFGTHAPAVGVGNDRFENGLVAAGLIRTPSELYDVTAGGELTPEAGSPC